MEKKNLTVGIGDHVKVVDEVGKLHDGLVTNCWGPGWELGTAGPTINVLFVTSDAAKTDPYGHQIERLSSCAHRLMTHAPGRYWYHPDEAL